MTEDVGLDGRAAPATMANLPWIRWMGLTARLSTLYGRQLMRPDYGLDMTDQVGRNLSNLDFIEIRRRIRRAVADLEPTLLRVAVSPDDTIDVTIRL